MAKIKISQFDTDPANNTDIDGINLAEGMAPGLVNNAIRTLMAQLKNQLTGADDDNRTIGGNLVVDGTSTLSGNVTITGTSTLTGTVTIGGRLADAFPSGTKMLFNQTSAPVGWVKDVTHDNKALRIVSGTAGTGGSVNFTTAFANQSLSGSTGGTTATGTVGDTTLTAAQIPAHTHSIAGSGTTSAVSNDHAHTFSASTGVAGGHSHSINDPSHSHGINYQGNLLYSGGGGNPNTFFGGGVNQSTATASTGISINAVGDHAHSVSGTTAGQNANHTHTYSFSGTSGSIGSSQAHTHGFTGASHNHTITSSVNLAVQYVDVIICTKS